MGLSQMIFDNCSPLMQETLKRKPKEEENTRKYKLRILG
jgi:hypothetical protein